MVTPNAHDSGPAMTLNEAPDNAKGVLKMQPIEHINIYPAGCAHFEVPLASLNEASYSWEDVYEIQPSSTEPNIIAPAEASQSDVPDA